MESGLLPEGAWVMDRYFVATFPYGPPDGAPATAVAAIVLGSESGQAIIFLSAEGWRQFVYNVLQTDFMLKALYGRQN